MRPWKQGVRFYRKGDRGCLDIPTTADSLDLVSEVVALCGVNVLDHTICVHEIEFAYIEWELDSCISTHKPSGIVGARSRVDTSHIEMRRETPKSGRAAADI